MKTLAQKERIRLGKWSEKELNGLIRAASHIPDKGLRIDMLSKEFLNVPYREYTLIGDTDTPEIFVIDLEGVDCFTFIDYIEAMRISDSFGQFKDMLRQVRYKGGVPSYTGRKHFFTDWVEFNGPFLCNVTRQIGGAGTRVVIKTLNIRGDDTPFLPGLVPHEREIEYIPGELINNELIGLLKTGDYVGVYSDLAGLDVSHVGIFIRNSNAVSFRHASSMTEYRKVLDQDFTAYFTAKPGMVVLRPGEH